VFSPPSTSSTGRPVPETRKRAPFGKAAAKRPHTFRPCRFSRLRRVSPTGPLQFCFTPQPTLGFTTFQTRVDGPLLSTSCTGRNLHWTSPRPTFPRKGLLASTRMQHLVMLHGPPRWCITLQSLPLMCSPTSSLAPPKSCGHLRRFPLAIAPDIAAWHLTSGPRSTHESVVQPPSEDCGHDSLLSWVLSAKKRPGTHPIRRPDEHLGTKPAVETTCPMPRQPVCEHTRRPDPLRSTPEGDARIAPLNPKDEEVRLLPHQTPKGTQPAKTLSPFRNPAAPPASWRGAKTSPKTALCMWFFTSSKNTPGSVPTR